MSFFHGKVVIVTGSGSGIGRGTALLFAKERAKLAIVDINRVALEETTQMCVQGGANPEDILELVGDLTNGVVNEMVISATVDKFGQLDILVNGAGGATFEYFGKQIFDIPLSEFDKMIDLNVKPIIRLSQQAVPYLEKTKGAIVNVSSVSSYLKMSSMPFYSAAKSALDQITIQMAGSLIKKGIRVNSVNPGPVLTNFLVTAGATDEAQTKMFETMAVDLSIPLGRIALPEDIGKVILFLADRSKSEILVGNIVAADGGISINRATLSKTGN